MHTEHLENVRPSWVGFGWFVSVAVASLVLVALNALGLIVEGSRSTGPWTVAALLVGFTLGGFFTGARVGAAPILHGVAMGLFSIVVWLVANLVGEALDAAAWNEVSPAVAAGGLLVQIVAAAVGAHIGSRGRRAAVPRRS
jgi:ABC-type amino acid transport system permease subunit